MTDYSIKMCIIIDSIHGLASKLSITQTQFSAFYLPSYFRDYNSLIFSFRRYVTYFADNYVCGLNISLAQKTLIAIYNSGPSVSRFYNEQYIACEVITKMSKLKKM